MDKILLKAAKHIMLFNTLSYFTWRILSARESGLPRERYENTLVCKSKILVRGELILFCFSTLSHWNSYIFSLKRLYISSAICLLLSLWCEPYHIRTKMYFIVCPSGEGLSLFGCWHGRIGVRENSDKWL